MSGGSDEVVASTCAIVFGLHLPLSKRCYAPQRGIVRQFDNGGVIGDESGTFRCGRSLGVSNRNAFRYRRQFASGRFSGSLLTFITPGANGWGGIRTLETLARLPVFKCAREHTKRAQRVVFCL